MKEKPSDMPEKDSPKTDPEVLETTDEWLENAALFLLSARSLMGIESAPLPRTACLMAHAAAERHLKTFLVFNREKYREYSHDLSKLVKASVALDKEFESIWDDAEFLNPYRRRVNYPDMHTMPLYISDKDAIEAIGRAEKIRGFVLKKLKEQGYR